MFRDFPNKVTVPQIDMLLFQSCTLALEYMRRLPTRLTVVTNPRVSSPDVATSWNSLSTLFTIRNDDDLQRIPTVVTFPTKPWGSGDTNRNFLL